TLNGGTGSNTLIGPNAPSSWTLTGLDAGTLNQVSFSSIQNLVGGTATDLFSVQAGAGLDGSITGGGGPDSLTGPNATAPTTWTLPGTAAGTLANAGLLSAPIAFSGVTSLVGGSGADAFLMQGAAGGFASANGGAGANTLDYSGYAGPVTVNLTLAAS